jgi:hypothetical protein
MENTIFCQDIAKVFEQIPKRYRNDGIDLDSVSNYFQENKGYEEYHNYILNFEFIEDLIKKMDKRLDRKQVGENFKKYYKKNSLTTFDLIKYYEKINRKVVMTHSSVFLENCISYDEYFVFRRGDIKSFVENAQQNTNAPNLRNSNIKFILKKTTY